MLYAVTFYNAHNAVNTEVKTATDCFQELMKAIAGKRKELGLFGYEADATELDTQS